MSTTKKKSVEPSGIQAYYTSEQLAAAVMAHIKPLLPQVGTCLDLCAGSGRLTQAARAYMTRMAPQFVEPNAQAAEALGAFSEEPGARLWQMSAEEFCRIHAEARMADVVLCNPPFGLRVGTTELGELITSLHLPSISHFEPYFLTIATALARSLCVFLLPESTAERPDLLSLLRHIASQGWELATLARLPLDGYEGACVRTHLWVLRRSWRPSGEDWPAALIEAIRADQVPDLVLGAQHTSVSHRTGMMHGYLLKGMALPLSIAPLWKPRAGRLADDAERLDPGWTPCPMKLGERIDRMGKMYELTRTGLQLAQGGGYADGEPAGPEFEVAERIDHYMRQGAHHTANHLMTRIHLDRLLRAFGQRPGASFLHMLKCLKPIPCTSPLSRDLERLGRLQGVTLKEQLDWLDAASPVAHRVGDDLIAPDHMKPAQLAQLALEFEEREAPEPAWLTQALGPLLDALELMPERLEPRATWWPRELVAELLGTAIDEEGLFCYAAREQGSPPWHKTALLCTNYLNFGKSGPIKEGVREYYAELCDMLAVALRAPSHPSIRPALKRTICLHYLAAYAPGSTHAHIAPPEARPAQPLRPWQIKDRAKMLRGDIIVGWDVGLGKTAGALNAAASHQGTSLIVVPTSVIMKWMEECQRFFPQIKVGLLGMRKNRAGKMVPSYGTLAEDAARLFYTERCQMIFTSHEVFGRFILPEHIQRDHDQRDAEALIGTRPSRRAERERAAFLQHAAQRNFLLGSQLTFCDLPLGSMLLVVDEAHRFKSLFPMPSSGWGGRLVMAGGCGTSKRARDMKIKCDLIREAGGKVLALTATPVTNSVAEIFNMLRIYAPGQLERLGLANTQQFIDTFCRLESITTISPSGEPVSGQTIEGFRQLPLLRSLWDQCLITRTAVDVGLKLPEATEHEITIAPTPKIRAFLDQCKDELGATLKGEADAKDDSQMHIFSILSRMDNVAAYPPLQGIEDENPKAEALVARVMEHYRAQGRGNQIIFVDRKEAHAGLKAMLVAAGIPDHEIAVFNADETADVGLRLKLQDAYNAGELRVVLGGAMISEGMDLQKNTVALHFMNLSWESQTIHQRKGRGIRQGNTVDRLDVYYYLLEGSTDAYRRAVTSNKSHWWEDLRRCQTDVLTTSLVASPIEDGLLISLARDPDAARATLKDARRRATLTRSCTRASALMQQLLRVADPLSRPHALSILQRLERSLRGLEGLEPGTCDAMIARVDAISHALHQVNLDHGARSALWEDIAKDFRALYTGPRGDSFRYTWKHMRIKDAADAPQTLEWGDNLPDAITKLNAGRTLVTTWLAGSSTQATALSDQELAALDGRMEVQEAFVGAMASSALQDEPEDLIFLEPAPIPTPPPAVTPAHPAATATPGRTATAKKVEASAQQTTLTLLKPVDAPQTSADKPTRSPQLRVLDLLKHHTIEDVARALFFKDAFALTKWLRSGKDAAFSIKTLELAEVTLAATPTRKAS